MADEFPFGRSLGRLKDQPGGLVIRDRADLCRCDDLGRPRADGNHWLTGPTREATEALIAAAQAAGHRIRIADGHRTRERQAAKFAAAVLKYKSAAEARKWVAHPDSAPHCSGQAVDFLLRGKDGKPLALSSKAAKSGVYKVAPSWQWLSANAGRFGFSPYVSEPWHHEHASG